jgi:Kef-type K+ transport system membrane component KefB
LLVPFFLAGIGMKVDLAIFRDPRVLALGGLLLAAAVASKFVGCGLGALRLGRREAVRIGVGMIPRGEVGMVVAQLGLAMAAISQPVYSVVVFMSVATTVLAPPLIKMAYATGGSPTTRAEAAR